MEFDLNQLINKFSSELNSFLKTGDLDWDLFLELSKLYSTNDKQVEIDPIAWVKSQLTYDFAF
jgi:hypothetical protein